MFVFILKGPFGPFCRDYVTFSPSRSVRCVTKVIPKKLQTRYNKGVQAYCKAKGEKYGAKGT